MLLRTLALTGLAAAAIAAPAAAMAHDWDRPYRDHDRFEGRRDFERDRDFDGRRSYVYRRAYGPWAYAPRPFYGWR